MRCFVFVLAVVCCAVLLHSSPAVAAPITLIHSGSGTGSLAGVPFADSAFTITAIGNTDNRYVSSPSVFTIAHDTASIDIAGVGTPTFLTATRTFVSNSLPFPCVGFSFASGADLFDGPQNPAFVTWDMLSSIGPVSGPGALMQWSFGVETNLGTLVFDDNFPPPSDWVLPTTFQAIVGEAPIPAPGAILLSALGVGLVGWLRRRGTV